MADAPPCPWCGEPLPRMMLEQYKTLLDDVPCPRCGKAVPRRFVRDAVGP